MDMYPFPEPERPFYTYIQWVPNQGWCGVHRLMFHWTVHIGINEQGYEDRYCFATEDMAKTSLMSWDGTGDMPGDWHKHPLTGRRRDPVTKEIWNENDQEAEARHSYG